MYVGITRARKVLTITRAKSMATPPVPNAKKRRARAAKKLANGQGFAAKLGAIMDPQFHVQVLTRALNKMVAALQGVKRNPVVIGPLGHQAWGVQRPPQSIDLLIPAGEEHRAAIFSAARGEGMRQVPDHPLRFTYVDRHLGGDAVTLDLTETVSPFLQQVYARAETGEVLQMGVPLARCEDLILLSIAQPDGHASVVELLRCTAGRMDAPYLKKEAEKAGTFDKIKLAWAEAKKT
jgi:hypothetical protein